MGSEYPFTHDLETLLDLVCERTEVTDEFRDLIEYTPFAVQHRYEGLGASVPAIDRNEAIRCLELLLDAVRRQVKEA